MITLLSVICFVLLVMKCIYTLIQMKEIRLRNKLHHFELDYYSRKIEFETKMLGMVEEE